MPPQFTKKPRSLKWTTAQPIEFKCAVTGSPVPSLSWLKNGNKLISNGRTRIVYHKGETVLTISSISSSDNGIYQCFARNEVGNIQASASLIVHKSGRETKLLHNFAVNNTTCKTLGSVPGILEKCYGTGQRDCST